LPVTVLFTDGWAPSTQMIEAEAAHQLYCCFGVVGQPDDVA
jgi:hypothetical protein